MSHRFLLDAMLGSLTRWLRLYGYDTIYLKDVEDIDLIELAKKEDRILLTRDELLTRIANKRGIHSYYLNKINDAEALLEVARVFNLSYNIENLRCPLCNYVINKIDKNEIKDLIPKNTFERFNDFWICKGCKNVYWKGSHWQKILSTLNNVNELKGNP
ncbi:hypothetical protein FJY84_04935 [Candidatus Bathyarchaeota archaeon]|nr:hypothetical protein [Candidatus Bathyarchaeota archaeon]